MSEQARIAADLLSRPSKIGDVGDCAYQVDLR